ncbi:Metabotropic glutamate receptor 2 [Portunus trituberculatus]|uniref:Metabotropic glutamate receptor 2 n=1 Tax=Portunus trituberculatus TaxID=210409 RepID=A0A5B7DXU6_PORTR|nr:Metabotropic glutamate receptor 2 [Portunus trituberculatus]
MQVYIRPDSLWAIGAMTFSSLGVVVTGVVVWVFVKHHDTPIVRASGRELSFVLLSGVFLCYAITFLLVLKTGFEPVRLETPRTPKHAWFHCTTAATKDAIKPPFNRPGILETESEPCRSADGRLPPAGNSKCEAGVIPAIVLTNFWQGRLNPEGDKDSGITLVLANTGPLGELEPKGDPQSTSESVWISCFRPLGIDVPLNLDRASTRTFSWPRINLANKWSCREVARAKISSVKGQKLLNASDRHRVLYIEAN